MTRTYLHTPVLLHEVIEYLCIMPNGTYVDATFGRGGHTTAILDRLSPNGRVIALDKDPAAFANLAPRMTDDKRLELVHSSFAKLRKVLEARQLSGKVNGVLLDLGVSSPQLDDPGRGFAFLQAGPLDMRMDTTRGSTAAQWINTAEQDQIADVLHEFGEERFARRIARAIVEYRKQCEITHTDQLAEIISQAIPKKEGHKHPATRSFQAIRIFINNELADLQLGLEQSIDILAPGGRLCVISFHSLEDRIVKRFIRRQQHGERLPKRLAHLPVTFTPRMKMIDKAIKPSAAEITANPRSRSAVLRVAEKLT